MKHTEFWTRMDDALGPAYAPSWADMFVIADLGGRTTTEALAAGLTPKEIFKDGVDLKPAQALIDKSDPETLTIKTPVLIAQGASDGTVIPSFTDALDRELRAKGTKVTYKTYAGVDHAGVVNVADKDAKAYIRKRLK